VASERVFLSIGSNLGDRAGNLARALAALRGAGAAPVAVSSCFETEPVGFADQPWFLNAALEVDTRLAPHALLACCQQIEQELGRVRSFRNAPRTLDLDLLLYGERVIAEPDLEIPHPRMLDRRFVLEPLAEIAPEALHPVARRTVSELLAACPDRSALRRLPMGVLE
jgi:2-amino-4-hydroxy-6-hydroxymethyldihydropteridine diphosphokinase